jgi:predicted ATPase
MAPQNLKEIRLLQSKWQAGTGWPKRLEWLEIRGIRGWEGQRISFSFPIVAVCGENGSGKSTILQAAASLYRQPKGRRSRHKYASDFLPDTPWDLITNAYIQGQVREGDAYPPVTKITKRTERWRGNPERRERWVEYVDLSRTQPVSARTGYSRIAKANVQETSARQLENQVCKRLASIMGRPYVKAKMALTNADPKRSVSVLNFHGSSISGFHQGAGEVTVTDLLEISPQKYGLLLIDEIETSLHPRAQRQLIRDLADLCRERELQIILTTHSPYILGELPLEGRIYIMEREGKRELMIGVSPDFAMTKMDDAPHPECDLYVEDQRARDLLREILVVCSPAEVERCRFIQYGAASVGYSLGQMLNRRAFPGASLVFVDGDKPAEVGCIQLPGNDAPERVVFEGLKEHSWKSLAERTGRDYAEVADACSRAMLAGDHKEWVNSAASKLLLPGDVLWSLMCQEWARSCLDEAAGRVIADTLKDTLENYPKSSLPNARDSATSLPSEPTPWPARPDYPVDPPRKPRYKIDVEALNRIETEEVNQPSLFDQGKH